MPMLERVKERLQSFGYELKDTDDTILVFCISKVENTIKNDCNISEIPEGLVYVAIDMIIGEFLTAKKTFSPNDITGIDLDVAIKQIQAGDTNTVFATGEGSLTAEQRLNNFINYLLTYGKEQFSCYRRLRW
jgi:methionine aminopeptidase